ncbi:large ribosomal subunit protein mL54 [Trichomonascus vanleenenianus]|uniref:mitochondrial 54S ribosomal protein mL54 MRPL37 n=1 Tax=Trichomonascus vanleenenianus TaxID=2268995 RepID=UPI003ECA0419
MRLLLRTSRLLARAYSTEAAAAPKKKIKVASIAPAGTVLKGINVRKNGEDPVALPEDQYPDWLWEVLDENVKTQKLEANPEKKAALERRQANREKIKSNNFLRSMSK